MADEVSLVRNTKAKSPIWAHFRLKKQNGTVSKCEAVCIHCNEGVKTSGGTSNLMTHMRRHHPSIFQNPNQNTTDSKCQDNLTSCLNTSETTARSSPVLPTSNQISKQTTITGMLGAKYRHNSTRAMAITNSIARFVVKDLRPYSVVSNEGFINMIHTLDSRYCVPGRQVFSDKIIPDMYLAVKQMVKKSLSSAINVALTTDGWSSRATQSYVTITSSHIDHTWQMRSYVLQTRAFSGSHSGSNYADLLKNAVKEWGLPKSPPLVTDNAANMLSAAAEFGSSIHIGCYAHTLNLAAQKSLKITSVDRILGRIRRVVSFFHRSCIGAELLRQKIELLGLPKHKLIQDVCTRWNSAADMLERYLELQPAVYAAFTSNDMRKLSKDIVTLSDTDVLQAQDVLQCLLPLREITKALCTEKTPTISIIIPLQHKLQSMMKQSEDDTEVVKEMKRVIWSDLSCRYKQQLEFLKQASAIDPRFKNLSFAKDDDERVQIFNGLALAAAEAYTQVKMEPKDGEADNGPADPPLPMLPELPQMIEGSSDDDGVEVLQENGVKQLKQETPAQSNESKGLAAILGDVYFVRVEKKGKTLLERSMEEIGIYRNEDSIDLDQSPLQWWSQREHKLPLLAKLAKTVLCIPSTSVPSERVFSTAGDIITSQRAAIKPENVDMLIFLKKNA